MDKYTNFIREQYEKGKIKDISEAFKDFPPEDEWHQGKIENVISEGTSVYGSHYKSGDIVFVKKYKYLDGTSGENHLFVIVDRNSLIVPIENFCMLLSSKIDKLNYKYNVLLKKDDMNHLKKDSIVKTDCIYNIADDQILFKIGIVNKDKIKEYLELYYASNK